MNAVTITSAASYRDLYFVHADGIERGPMPLADALAASARSLTASAAVTVSLDIAPRTPRTGTRMHAACHGACLGTTTHDR